MTGREPKGYKEALEELDGILAELDSDELDVDVLAHKVRRAGELLEFCRGRIAETRMEVERVVNDLGAQGR